MRDVFESAKIHSLVLSEPLGRHVTMIFDNFSILNMNSVKINRLPQDFRREQLFLSLSIAMLPSFTKAFVVDETPFLGLFLENFFRQYILLLLT